MLCFLVAALVVVVDQLTKYAVVLNMELGESIPLVGKLLSLHYIWNDGAAFSILEGRQGFLIAVVSVVVVVVLVYAFLHRKKVGPLFLWSMGCIAGGGVGNLIDRVRQGYVVDFLELPRWPVFNVADIAVCAGCVLLVIYMGLVEPKRAKRAGNGEA